MEAEMETFCMEKNVRIFMFFFQLIIKKSHSPVSLMETILSYFTVRGIQVLRGQAIVREKVEMGIINLSKTTLRILTQNDSISLKYQQSTKGPHYDPEYFPYSTLKICLWDFLNFW